MMKLLKILALGLALALTSACSDDDGSGAKKACSPVGEIEVLMEQGFSNSGSGTYYKNMGSSARNAQIRRLNYASKQESTQNVNLEPDFAKSLDSLEDFELVENADGRSMKTVSSTSPLVATAKDYSTYYSNRFLNVAAVSDIKSADAGDLKLALDNEIASEGVKACSSQLEVMLVEENKPDSKLAVIRYTVKVRE